jgi:hypothetical protein
VATSPVMDLLAAGLPLTLLCDLVSTRDPESAAVNLAERPPGDPLLLEIALSQPAVASRSA